MLTKKEVKSYKKSVELDDRYISPAMVLNLIETLKEAIEVIKEYDFEKRLESRKWGINYNSDRIKVKPKMFLAKYERED